jgi:hypothetical protein
MVYKPPNARYFNTTRKVIMNRVKTGNPINNYKLELIC